MLSAAQNDSNFLAVASMDSNLITAFAGLAGAVLGGVTSFATTWLTQRNAIRTQNQHDQRIKLENLFGDFISEASRLYGDAISHDKADIVHLVKLYALLGRIRLIASAPVVRAGEITLSSIVDTYAKPNRTLTELKILASEGGLDVLLEFGEACRAELRLSPLRG